MNLPAGATIVPGEEKRVADAMAALRNDPHAPREITVRIKLHIHHEYPKHVDGKIIYSAEEEGK